MIAPIKRRRSRFRNRRTVESDPLAAGRSRRTTIPQLRDLLSISPSPTKQCSRRACGCLSSSALRFNPASASPRRLALASDGSSTARLILAVPRSRFPVCYKRFSDTVPAANPAAVCTLLSSHYPSLRPAARLLLFVAPK